MCASCLTGLQSVHGVTLDSSFKTLRLASNYKGDDVSQSFVPSTDRFQTKSLSEMMSTIGLYRTISPAAAMAATNAASSGVGGGGSRGSGNGVRWEDGKPGRASTKSGFQGGGGGGGGGGVVIGGGGNSSTTSSSLSMFASSTTAGSELQELTIYPIPGFVVKTKDSIGLKVFLNVCHHSSLPAYQSSAGTTKILARKLPFFSIGPEEKSFDKDGVESIVVAMCCNTEVYNGLDRKLGVECPLTVRVSFRLLLIAVDQYLNELKCWA